jgi:hypothetical protein
MIAPSLLTIANHKHPAYSSPVATLLATGFGHPIKLAQQRPYSTAGAFFMPAVSLYGGCVWEAFEPAGCQLSRLTNLHTAATHSFGHERGSSKPKVGATPMNHIHTALKNRAAAHKSMAFAALRADSSASVRLGRYRKHIDRSRALLALAVLAGGEA